MGHCVSGDEEWEKARINNLDEKYRKVRLQESTKVSNVYLVEAHKTKQQYIMRQILCDPIKNKEAESR